MGIRSDLEKISSDKWSNARVSIRPLVTESDLIYATYDCELDGKQKELVNPAWFSVSRAYLFREDNYPCIICDEQMVPIGFINLCKWLGEGDAYSWSYFIDRSHQRKGYGKSAAEAAIRILKTANPDKSIKLATEKDNEKAQRLYRSLGFHLLPELDGDDIVFGL